MIIEYEGRQLRYDPEDLDVEQALKIEEHIGGPMMEYQQGCIVGSVKCIQALGWLILHGGDLGVPIASVNFKFKKLSDAFGAAAEREAAEEKAAAAREAAGPTELPGPLNGNGDASIPDLSRPGSLTA